MLTDQEVKDLLASNPQAAQIFESLRAYIPAEKYSAIRRDANGLTST